MLAGCLHHDLRRAGRVGIDSASADENDSARHHLRLRRVVVGKAKNAGDRMPALRTDECLQRVSVGFQVESRIR